MPKRVDPQRNMRHENPYEVYRALNRLAVTAKMLDNEQTHFSLEEVAALLYLNWDDLNETQREKVIRLKLKTVARFLKVSYKVEELEVRRNNPKYRVSDIYLDESPYIYVGQGRYRARRSAFADIPGYTREMVERATRDCIEDSWRTWPGYDQGFRNMVNEIRGRNRFIKWQDSVRDVNRG